MPTNLRITSGSIFADNPITIAGTAASIDKTAFHRVVFDVTVNGEVLTSSIPVITEGGQVEIDISSALRAILDSTERTPTDTSVPAVSWSVHAYDEWMKEGQVLKDSEANLSGTTVYAGAFSDYERITGNTSLPRRFSRKPSSLPEIVCVGDTVCVPATGSVPQSQLITVSKPGKQDNINVFAIPVDASEQRMTIHFINSYGCLESISVPRSFKRQSDYVTTTHVKAKQERFDNPSHAVVRKQQDRETWQFTSGPIDEQWQQWFLHDFLMAEDAWLNISNSWVRIHIIPEETITYLDKTNNNVLEVLFSAQFDINGPLTA